MKNVHEIEVKIEGKEWKDAVDTAFNEEQKKVSVDGFRKGKVPRNIYESKYGKVLDDNKLEPIIDPNIDIVSVDDEKAVLKFVITTKPEVKIKKYKDLGVKKETVKVTKKEIDEEIDKLRNRFADLEIKEGKVALGDITVIEFEGFINDVAFEGGQGENYSLTIGSNTFIPGFEDQLIGHKTGDKVDVKVTFPEDYHQEDLKGKEALFKVTIHEVKTKKLPELNEDFFIDLEMKDVNSEESLRKVIEDQIKARKEYDIENKYIDDVLEAVSKETTVDIPNELVEEELDRMIHEYGHNLEHQGLTLEMFYQYTNSNEQALREQMRNDATIRVKYRFILEEIAVLEKIEITDKEIDEEAKKLADSYKISKDEFIKEFGGKEALRYDLTMQKVIDILKK